MCITFCAMKDDTVKATISVTLHYKLPERVLGWFDFFDKEMTKCNQMQATQRHLFNHLKVLNIYGDEYTYTKEEFV